MYQISLITTKELAHVTKYYLYPNNLWRKKKNENWSLEANHNKKKTDKILVEMRSCYVTQAGLKLLYSRDPPPQPLSSWNYPGYNINSFKFLTVIPVRDYLQK